MDSVYDVAVVGFGPSGAVAAGLLGGYGLNTFVCDRLTEVYDKPRAIAIDHEILRVFQQLGIIEEAERYIEPFTPSEYYGVDGQLIRRLTMVDPPYPLGYTPSNVFTQPPVERVLRAHARGLTHVTTRLGVEVKGLDQNEEFVTLQLRDAGGGSDSIRARYVIGCDGASSTIRELVGISLQDLGFDEPWLVVDVIVNEQGLAKLPKTSMQYCEPDRPSTLVIGPGKHRRWEIALHEGEDPKLAATPGETWKLLARWIGPDDGELWRQASYRFHALVATEWRKGRVFIAGDAAHQQPPFLGQGMCQGVRDVANLTWKLSTVLRGEVAKPESDDLLDTYGVERKDHVTELTSRIKAIGAVICERDPAQARARDARMLAETGGTVMDTPRQDILPRLQLGLLSPTLHSANGTIFPQPWVVGVNGRERFDHVVGDGWVLVLSDQFDGIVAAAATRVPNLHIVKLGTAEGALVETDGVLAVWFLKYGCNAALVRPDRYVFGVADSASSLDSLLADIAKRLGSGNEESAQRPLGQICALAVEDSTIGDRATEVTNSLR